MDEEFLAQSSVPCCLKQREWQDAVDPAAKLGPTAKLGSAAPGSVTELFFIELGNNFLH